MTKIQWIIEFVLLIIGVLSCYYGMYAIGSGFLACIPISFLLVYLDNKER